MKNMDDSRNVEVPSTPSSSNQGVDGLIECTLTSPSWNVRDDRKDSLSPEASVQKNLQFDTPTNYQFMCFLPGLCLTY